MELAVVEPFVVELAAVVATRPALVQELTPLLEVRLS